MNTDSTNNKNPKKFRTKHRVAAIVLAPLLIVAFLSVFSLRAEIYSRSKNFKFQRVLNKIVKIFTPKRTSHGYDSTRPKMAQIEHVIDTYLLNTQQYPKTLNDLMIDPNLSGWTGPYLKNNKQLNDPWDNPFVYIPNSAAANGYDLISYGADGKPGGKGYDMDIYND